MEYIKSVIPVSQNYEHLIIKILVLLLIQSVQVTDFAILWELEHDKPVQTLYLRYIRKRLALLNSM